MAKLYELANNYRNLTELIDREDVEQDLIQNALKECHGDIEEKVDNIVKLIRNTESDIEGYKAEEKRLNARRKSLENTVTSFKFNTTRSKYKGTGAGESQKNRM